ncbi:MAG: sigma-70 family RNA polymerase sigma factor [Chitinophagaceae bacterium]|nr:sigma-70 family RNA polymerase sigma factor [Chitinophagaceae bacterium]
MLHKNFDHITDAELLENYYQEKDTALLGTLLQRYTLLLFGTCLKYLKNETEARDAVQQVFLKSLTEIPKYKITYFKSWIYMVTKNHCLMMLRNKNLIVELEQQAIPEDDEVKLELQFKEEQLNFLEQAVDELNDGQKQCIQLFYLQKKTYLEVCETTGYSLLQVKSFIQNGKRNLRILMEKKGMKEHE